MKENSTENKLIIWTLLAIGLLVLGYGIHIFSFTTSVPANVNNADLIVKFEQVDIAITKAYIAFGYEVLRLEEEGKLIPSGPDLIESDEEVRLAFKNLDKAYRRHAYSYLMYRSLVEESGSNLSLEAQAKLSQLLEQSQHDLITMSNAVEVLKRK